MKKIQLTQFYLFAALLFLLAGCSDDFLKKHTWEPDLGLAIQVAPPLSESGKQKIIFELPEAGNSSYSIVKYPMWMDPASLKGVTSDGLLTLEYHLNNAWSWISSYPDFNFCFEVESLGKVEVLVSFREMLDIAVDAVPEILHFGSESIQETLQLFNKSRQGISVRVESYPTWIRPDGDTEFYLSEGGTVNLSFKCDRSGTFGPVQRGYNTGYIVLKYNGEDRLIPVIMKVE